MHRTTARAAARTVTLLALVACALPLSAAPEDEPPLPPTIEIADWPERRPEIVLPPAWAFGVLYGGYTDQEGSLKKIHDLVAADLPIDAYWIDSWFWDFGDDGAGPDGYLDFVGDQDAYPDPAALWGEMQRLSIKSGVWVWDRILRTGNEAVWDEFTQRGFLGPTYTMSETWHTDGKSDAAFVDFDNPKAAFYWQERLRPFFDAGLDFLKIDAGAKFGYMEAAYDATARYGLETEGRGYIMSHANMFQPPPHQGGDDRVYNFPTKWTGDAAIAWDQKNYPDLRGWRLGGLKQQVEIFATRDDKGHYPFLTMDTGGYSHGTPNDELYTRWSQFSAFTPIMSVFGAADKNESNNPLTFSDDTIDSFRKHTHLRMRLFPYIYSYAHLSRLTPHNIIRPSRVRNDQYLFGEEFIVAPVYEPGVQDRYVYFPAGVWIDYWTGERHDQGYLGTTRRVNVQPDRLPLFIRDGAIVPMRDYARAVELGTNDLLHLHIWPSGRSRFILAEDDGTSNDYREHRIALTRITAFEDGGFVRITVEPAEGGYKGMPEEREMIIHLRAFDADAATIGTRRLLADKADHGVSFRTRFRTDRGLILETRGRRTDVESDD